MPCSFSQRMVSLMFTTRATGSRSAAPALALMTVGVTDTPPRLGMMTPWAPAQQGRADHRAQVVGVFDAVADHQEGGLALPAGGFQQVLHLCIGDLAGKGGHSLVALGAGQQPEFGGVYPLDGGRRPLWPAQYSRTPQPGPIPSASRTLSTARRRLFQQLGHRVFAVDQTSAGLGVLVLARFCQPGAPGGGCATVGFLPSVLFLPV